MFQQFISSYSEQLFLSLGEKRDRYALHELASNTSLPVYTQSFISSEIAWWSYTAVLRKGFGTHFPINHEQAFAKGEALSHYLNSIAECDANELQEMIRISIEMYLNALARPIMTSSRFLFRNESLKSAHELQLRANALSNSIPFLNEAIQSCIGIDSRHPTELLIKKEQFTEEIQHASTGFISKQHPKDLSISFSKMFELIFALMGKEEIPVELLIAFFQEANHAAYASYFNETGLRTFNKATLFEALHQALGQTIEVQEEERPNHDKRNDRTYFADKGIILPKPRLTIKPSMRHGIPKTLELSPIEFPSEIQSPEIIDELLKHELVQEQPLRLIRRSFLGSLPIPVQVHYANAIFDGNITLLRKLGASIDKTVGSEAAMLTCKAYVEQYGMPIRDAEDPLNGLCDLVMSFCSQRES
ncbi:MAG: hypothetical protein RJA11_1290 [Bacteroidota bacterium]